MFFLRYFCVKIAAVTFLHPSNHPDPSVVMFCLSLSISWLLTVAVWTDDHDATGGGKEIPRKIRPDANKVIVMTWFEVSQKEERRRWWDSDQSDHDGDPLPQLMLRHLLLIIVIPLPLLLILNWLKLACLYKVLFPSAPFDSWLSRFCLK